MQRTNFGSGYKFETEFGYSRAVRVGPWVFVSGTTARGADLAGNTYQQLTSAIQLVATALKMAGAELRHVVRTVVYTVELGEEASITRAHKEAFGAVLPASTLVQVAQLSPPSATVEIEVTAVISDD